MAVTAKCYGLFFSSLANKEIDWNTDTIKCMLTTNTYTPDQDTHQYKSSVTNEVTGTNYVAGGATLANPTITYTAGTNVLKLDADDASWATSTITLPASGSAIVYDSSPGADASRPLVCYQTTDAQVASTAGTFTVAWHADGIVAITVA
jgi:hypothetical protein